ncbi:MAG TPA: ATP-binding protein [Candidatus Nanoarchaeia archaeon]|nr:ATP-binding protein [Candidatus Nanoarchaeia archaeon]
MTQIKDVLLELNPWWKQDFKAEFKEREVYSKIQKFMPLRQILAFTGLRRVGKTTLLRKIIEDAITKENFDPKRVMYFSFDECREAEIKEVLRSYEELTENSLREKRSLVVLDEVQKASNWEGQVKSIYDLYEKHVKIIVSGSESLFIRSKSKETLAGRIFEFKIEPLSFREFLRFKEAKFEPIPLYKRELEKLFEEFTLTQGFPELIGIQDKEIIKKYLKESIIEKVVFQDMQRLFPIKDASLIESLLSIFLEEPGQIIEISDLANDLNVSRQTLSNYILYLEHAFLIRKLYNFSRNRRKVERKLKKYYPTIVSPTLVFRQDDVSKSKVFEWLIVNQLQAEFFWRDPYKNEVDIVLFDKTIMPIEVKYGKIELEGMRSFMEKFKVKEGCIISRNVEEKKKTDGRTISIIPAFRFLLGRGI